MRSGTRRRLETALLWVRHAADRLRHPSRRRALIAELAAGPCPASVLFVCLGNICRSPYAAAAFEQALPSPQRGRIRSASAGFVAPGNACPTVAREVAGARGIDLSGHRSRLITAATLSEAELVVVMEPHHARHLGGLPSGAAARFLVLGDLDPEPIGARSIRDPMEQPEHVFERTYARIDRCVRELAAALAVACAGAYEERDDSRQEPTDTAATGG